MKKNLVSIVAISLIAMVGCSKKEEPTPTPEPITVTDICGKTYPAVTIGTQVWMAENLKCDKYDTQSEAYNANWLTDNTLPSAIEQEETPYYTDVTDNTKWFSTDYSSNLSDEQIAKLGYIYNWAAAVGIANGTSQTSAFTGNRQGICPNGWHVPTYGEWETLYNYVYNDKHLTSNEVGKYLKTTSGWYNNNNGTDAYGFALLPAGMIGYKVVYVGRDAAFGSATPYEPRRGTTGVSCIEKAGSSLELQYQEINTARSVRCVKN